MENPLLTLAAFILPIIAFRDFGFAYYHLYQRLEPDPVRRAWLACLQYLSILVVWFPIWLASQGIGNVLLGITNPFLSVVISTIITLAANSLVLKKPVHWRGLAPYLSKNRTYDAFIRVLADRASDAKGVPEKREQYLNRLYRDGYARMQATGAFLSEHRDKNWIYLKAHQLSYHPNYNRLRWTLLYLVALLPVVVPQALAIIDPTFTNQNASLTFAATILATVFYSPLFDPASAKWLFGLAATLVVCMGIMMEFSRTRAMVPGFAGLIILAILGVVISNYVATYVIAQVDTPIIAVTDYLLDKLKLLDQRPAFIDGAIRFFGFGDQLKTAELWAPAIRAKVLDLQSVAGGIFIIPAVVFWSLLSFRAIWELHFSSAADVTFHHRMRKPEV